MTVTILQGDLSIEPCDAVVNPTNSSMNPTGGIDTKLHRKFGSFFTSQVQTISNVLGDKSCPVGDSRIFIAYGGERTAENSTSARFVINTVGPNHSQEGPDLSAFHLRECYRTSLALANIYRLTSIAYPAISCGACKYPPNEAAQVGIKAIRQNAREVKDVRFVLFERHIYEAFVKEWTDYAKTVNRDAKVFDDTDLDRSRDRDDERFQVLSEMTLTQRPNTRNCVLCIDKLVATGQNFFCSECSIKPRSEMFKQFLELLRIASEKSFGDLEDACKSLQPIVSSFQLAYTPAQIFDHSLHQHDRTAGNYLQRYCDRKFNRSAIPIHIVGDGNCFYNTFVTLFTAGTTAETSTLTSVELRTRNVIELTLNRQEYKTKYDYIPVLDSLENYIQNEMVCDANYVAVWDILSIPSVLNIKVITVYPRVNGGEDLYYQSLDDKSFEPLTNTINPQKQLSEVKLLFSNSNPWNPSASIGNAWTPNHYVPILKLNFN